MDRRTYYALLAGGWTVEQAILLGVLGARRMGWAEWLDAARSGRAPSRALRDAAGALEARGVVALGPDARVGLVDPSEWLDAAALRRVEAAARRRPDPPAGEADRPAIARCRAVFGDAVAEKMREQWPVLMRDLKGKAGHLLAAVAECEIREFDPDNPIAYLVKAARGLIAEGDVPGYLRERLRGEPRVLRRPPAEVRVFRADDVDWNPEGAVSPRKVLRDWRLARRRLLAGEVPPDA